MRFRPELFLSLLILILSSCMAIKKQPGYDKNVKPEIIGHRGFAGRFPQNTLPGFLEAVDEEVDALELDVVISADQQVVVSHEPYMSADYMLTPSRNRISPEKEKAHNLYEMQYERIRSYEAGLGTDREYPEKASLHTYKPLLRDVFLAVENYIKVRDLKPVEYYIELKSSPENYGIFQPLPSEFAELVLEVIKENNMENRVILQSFDPQLLNQLHEKDPQIRISYLTGEIDLAQQLNELNFVPQIYSPDYRTLENEDMVKLIRQKGMQVIPWTVNSRHHLKKMKRFGVDAIITDYPDRALRILR